MDMKRQRSGEESGISAKKQKKEGHSRVMPLLSESKLEFFQQLYEEYKLDTGSVIDEEDFVINGEGAEDASKFLQRLCKEKGKGTDSAGAEETGKRVTALEFIHRLCTEYNGTNTSIVLDGYACRLRTDKSEPRIILGRLRTEYEGTDKSETRIILDGEGAKDVGRFLKRLWVEYIEEGLGCSF